MSFYTALTGLNGAQTELATIANNIANASTNGFKKSRVAFGDIIVSTPLQDPKRVIGSGIAVRGVTQQFGQGAIATSDSGGSNGIMGGRSLRTENGVAPHASVSGARPTPVQGGGGGPLEARVNSHDKATNPGNKRAAYEERFNKVERIINARLAGDPTLKGLKGQIRFVRTHDGLRIDLVERADCSMFGLGTSVFSSAAAVLLRTVAKAVADVSNTLTVRGHTDALAYARGGINNWTLSTAHADATRRALADAGVESGRFRRIEGVADTDPYNPKDADDPRNRRISVTLMYRDGEAPPST